MAPRKILRFQYRCESGRISEAAWPCKPAPTLGVMPHGEAGDLLLDQQILLQGGDLWVVKELLPPVDAVSRWQDDLNDQTEVLAPITGAQSISTTLSLVDTMENRLINTRWHRLDDPDAVAVQTARRILQSASRAITERGLFRIVLAGGRSPEAAYRLLVDADTDWSRWEVYFGDERCLPAGDAARNSTMAARALFDAVAIPTANVHPIPAERGAEAAAGEYEPVIRAAMPFDLVLLGIGEDGHTASLFPEQQHPADQLVHAVHNAPKPPPDRVSLSVHALSEAREVLILASGAGKQDAIRAWQAGKPVPIAEIGGSAPVDVLLDKAAQP